MSGERIPTHCDCRCHRGFARKERGLPCCYCAPCAYCRKPTRLIFISDHQALCRNAFVAAQKMT